MKNDWNLERTKSILGYKFKQNKSTDAPEFGFYEVHVETFHKKLIEDIQKLSNEEMHPSRKLMVVRIINKRIGKGLS